MLIEIKVPSVGESVTEALLAQWFKNDGDMVKKDEPLFVIETDKVTLEVVAEADGVLTITMAEGETVAIGAVVGTLDPQGVDRSEAPADTAAESATATEAAPPVEPPQPPPSQPVAAAPPPETATPEPVPQPPPDSREPPPTGARRIAIGAGGQKAGGGKKPGPNANTGNRTRRSYHQRGCGVVPGKQCPPWFC